MFQITICMIESLGLCIGSCQRYLDRVVQLIYLNSWSSHLDSFASSSSYDMLDETGKSILNPPELASVNMHILIEYSKQSSPDQHRVIWSYYHNLVSTRSTLLSQLPIPILPLSLSTSRPLPLFSTEVLVFWFGTSIVFSGI